MRSIKLSNTDFINFLNSLEQDTPAQETDKQALISAIENGDTVQIKSTNSESDEEMWDRSFES